jgi:large subunit ribosomal protein L21
MYAIVEINKRLYRIEKGTELYVDLLNKDAGEKLKFDTVTLYRTDDEVLIGNPFVKGISVEGRIIEPVKKGEKLVIFKYKQKTSYRRKIGHRQKYTKIQITGISREKEKKAKTEKKAEEARA